MLSLDAWQMSLPLWTNLENISQILIFVNQDQLRNSMNIRPPRNFPEYGIMTGIALIVIV